MNDQKQDSLAGLQMLLEHLANEDQTEQIFEDIFEVMSVMIQRFFDQLKPFVKRSVKAIFSGLQSSKARYFHASKSKGTKVLTQIATKIEFSEQDILKVIQQLINTQKQLFLSTVNKEKASQHIFTAWRQLLCVKKNEHYIPYFRPLINQSYPTLFGLIKEHFHSKGANNQQRDNYNQAPQQIMQAIMNEISEDYQLFAEQTIHFLIIVFGGHKSQKSKNNACKFIQRLITNYGIKSSQSKKQIKMFIKNLLNNMDENMANGRNLLYLSTLEVICRIQSLFQRQQILQFLHEWSKIFEKIDNSLYKPMQLKSINSHIQLINSLLQRMCQSFLIRNILKLNEMPQQQLYTLIDKIISNFFIENQTDRMILFGLYFIISIVETFGHTIILKQLDFLEKILPILTKRENSVVKEEACKLIGILAQMRQQPYEMIVAHLDLLKKLFDPMRRCGDAFLSYGKIIKANCVYYNLQSYLRAFLAKIPFDHRKASNDDQMTLLIDILESNPGILHEDKGEQASCLKNLLRVYSQAVQLGQKLQASTLRRVGNHIRSLTFEASLNNGLSQAWRQIGNRDLRVLKIFMINQLGPAQSTPL